MSKPSVEVRPGMPFGRWVVTGDRISVNHRAYFLCRCACGTERQVERTNLIQGLSTSCGCARNEVTANRSTKHGDTPRGGRSRLYAIWAAMKARCTNENIKCFHMYGGKGITVCDEWLSSFASFRDWAMANGYRDNLTIDRMEGSKGYSPDNCRWATATQQRRNQERNTLLTAFGETKTLADWGDDPRCTVGQRGLRMRIKRGWDVEHAISKPKADRFI